MTLTITSLFCGAGGDAQGAEQVPGVSVRMAANHWQLAVDTHATNFPHADHDVANISLTPPRRYPRTDLLWASPECTNHSQAKGRKRAVDAQPDLFGEVLPNEAAERSRATMWDVLRFAEVHHYRGGVVENVVQMRDWVLWPAWIEGLHNLGYDHRVVYLNSMFAQGAGLPAPQSRDRLYVVFWRIGERQPDLARWAHPLAFCEACAVDVRAFQSWKRLDRQRGKYREQYVWRCATCQSEVFPGVLPAAHAIDWALPGDRIGARLSPKTRARITAGLGRYGRPIHLEVAGNTYERGSYVRAWPVDQPFKTMHTSASKAVAWPPLLVPAGGTWNDDAVPVTQPFRTRTTRESEGLVRHQAMIMRNNSTDHAAQAWPCTPVTEPLRTITTGGHQSLVRWDHLIYDYNTDARNPLRPVTDPLPTQTTIEGDALVGPELDIEDCTFRMLEPHEIQGAMAFTREYEVLGKRRERIRQLGNAVTPPAARDLIAALAEAVTGERIEVGA
jgi:DNA (cytosine-5)-methyltransferase 1